MGFFRICKNDITDLLRDTFNAFPLRIPETRMQPLVVMGQKGSKMDYRGELQYLLSDGQPIEIDIRESAMANAALDRSKSISLNFGLKILEGFLSGFGMSPAPIGASLKGVKEISFSFTNCKRRFIDPGQLGSILRGRNIDLSHGSLGIFRGEDPYRMLLVSDAIVSKSFTINIEKTNDIEFDASLPELQPYLADVDAKVKVNTQSSKSITFEGEDYLTFAFSCLLLEMDQQSGALAIGETVRSKGAGGQEEATPYATIDEDVFEPGMVEIE